MAEKFLNYESYLCTLDGLLPISYTGIMKDIVIYKTIDGECPYTEWVESLSFEYQLRVYKRINKLKDGLKGDWKRLQNSNLSELRLDFGKGYRIYYKELNNIVILLFAGSDKKNQAKAIKQASKYYEDFVERNYKG